MVRIDSTSHHMQTCLSSKPWIDLSAWYHQLSKKQHRAWYPFFKNRSILSSKELRDFLSQILVHDLQRRSEISALLQHTFITTATNSKWRKIITEAVGNPIKVRLTTLLTQHTHLLRNDQNVIFNTLLSGFHSYPKYSTQVMLPLKNLT